MIWKLTQAQKQQVEALIPTCCNWDNGQCLALDMTCPQQLSVSRINCTYFRGAVLPAQKELYEEIIRNNGGSEA